MLQSRVEIEASVTSREARPPVEIRLNAPQGWSGEVALRLGAREVARLDGAAGTASFPLDPLLFRTAADYEVSLDGAGADWAKRGEFFEALAITPDRFFDRVQLHHSRFASPVLLELAAYGFLVRHPEADFVLRASALTILGHRYLERSAAFLSEAEAERVTWILAQAEKVCREGAELIHQVTAAEKPVDWQHVRWTVSLSTVAAHLSLYRAAYERALTFLDLSTRHTHLVGYAKVSALNFVICAFAEGAIADMLGQKERARKVLTLGVEAVKPIVQAQNLMENVWVLGDLNNVLRASRQCYVAMLRLGLREAVTVPPVISDDIQIEVGQVKSPLSRILSAGSVPELEQHLARRGKAS